MQSVSEMHEVWLRGRCETNATREKSKQAEKRERQAKEDKLYIHWIDVMKAYIATHIQLLSGASNTSQTHKANIKKKTSIARRVLDEFMCAMADARLIPFSTLYYFKIVGAEANVEASLYTLERCNKVLYA